MSLEEKKALYRASFKQTFSEFNAPTGEWKSIVGWSLFFASLSIWIYMGMKLFGSYIYTFNVGELIINVMFCVIVYSPLPDSFSEENQRAQFRRMLDLKMNPVEGLASRWDYEKDDWKK